VGLLYDAGKAFWGVSCQKARAKTTEGGRVFGTNPIRREKSCLSRDRTPSRIKKGTMKENIHEKKGLNF